MKRSLNVLWMCCVLAVAGCSPDESDTLAPDEVFVKYYGGAGTDEAVDFVVNLQGNEVDSYVIFGSSDSYALTNQVEHEEWVLIFADKGGKLISDGVKRFPVADLLPASADLEAGNGNKRVVCRPSRIKKISSGGYLLIGTLEYFEKGRQRQTDMLVIRVDDNGNYAPADDVVLLGASTEVVVDGNGNETATLSRNQTGVDVVEISEGFICLGDTDKVDLQLQDPTQPDVTNTRDFYIAKLDFELDTVWTGPYGSGVEDWAAGLASIRSGAAILVSGSSFSSVSNNLDVSLAEVPVLGASKPVATDFSTSGSPAFAEEAVRLWAISDNDVFITGNATSGSSVKPFLMRITSGDMVSNTRIDVPDGVTVKSFYRTLGGRFVYAATTSATDDGGAHGQQMLLLRTDDFGGKTAGFGEDAYGGFRYGGSGDDVANGIIQLPDGKFVLLANVGVDNNAFTLMGLIKTNSRGILGK